MTCGFVAERRRSPDASMAGPAGATLAVLLVALVLLTGVAHAAGMGSIDVTEGLGHPAAAYQVFAGSVGPDGSVADVTWGTGVDGTGLLAELRGARSGGARPFRGCEGARDVAAVLNVLVEDPATGRWEPGPQDHDTAAAVAFARVAVRHLSAGTPFRGTAAWSSAEGLDEGWYLVASLDEGEPGKGTALLFPSLVTVGTGSVALVPKQARPALSKWVLEDGTGRWQRHADFDRGQTYRQRLVATLGDADLSYYQGYALAFHDTLPEGVCVAPESVSVTLVRGESPDGEGAPLADLTSAFEVSLEGRELAVRCDDILSAAGSDARPQPGDRVVASYEAYLGASVGAGSPGATNAARLVYSSSPLEPAARNSTPDDTNVVYTYRLVVRKVDRAQASVGLAGASFVLQDASGAYALTRDGQLVGWVEQRPDACLLTTDAEGTFCVDGLDAGDYTLTEVGAPAGYDLDEVPLALSIRSSVADDEPLGSLVVTVGGTQGEGDTTTGSVEVVVTNEKAPLLPMTGDEGIPVTALVGAALAGAGSLGLALSLRSRGRRP